MPERAGHRQLDHTADLALELWAPTEEALLEEAARAVVAILTEDTPTDPVDATQARTLSLTALDGPDRLVRWMNEILTLAVLEGYLTASARIELEPPGALRATLTGRPDAHEGIVTELKSVTYHDLSLTKTKDTWRARVVIDV